VDANKAITLDPNNSKAYLRKGIACFDLEEYQTVGGAAQVENAVQSNHSLQPPGFSNHLNL
jgi:hypothetical protein